ncbi:MAG: hypothetical protein IT204_03860 [Fimbriimonadaceae bacterium]|nr:hypothetical protein [Fimbriimonadaceae bacterium]
MPALTCCLLATALAAPPLLRNGSFEAGNFPLAGVGYVSQGNRIDAWEALGEVARNPQGFAFHDNGATPDGRFVVALQNLATLRQEVGPFERDGCYRLRLRANGRASDLAGPGNFGQLEVRLNGTPLLGPQRVPAVDAGGQFQQPWRTFEVPFVTGDGQLWLELRQVDPADGVSVLIDQVELEPLAVAPADAVRVNRSRARPAGRPVTEFDFRQVQWIWSADLVNGQAPVGTRWFRRTFDVPDLAAVRQAVVIASADNSANLYLNGTYLGTAPSFGDWYEMDGTPYLQPGRNVLAVEAVNAGQQANPAGLAAALMLLDAGGRALQALPTGPTWRVSAQASVGWQQPQGDEAGWAPAAAQGAVGCPPWNTQGFLTWLVPPDFPRAVVPGQERYTELLSQLHWLHYGGSGPKATMWDTWLSTCSLWPATGAAPGQSGFREIWRDSLLQRPIDREGYVSTIQHHGFGHGEGWPFPTAPQAGGVMWQFASEHTAYRVGAAKLEGWQLDGLEVVSLDKVQGLVLRVTAPTANLTTPPFDIDRQVAPFVRLEWNPELPAGSRATLHWRTPQETGFTAPRSLPLPLVSDTPGRPYTHVPLYRQVDPATRIGGLRLSFAGAVGGQIRLLGLLTACDTRHPVNNPTYLAGCTEYFRWTGDLPFLQQNLARMRTALEFALTEFGVPQHGFVRLPWVGHDGSSGLHLAADGSKTVRPGYGIGANYWDLLPFSGDDSLATIYTYDALRRMAELEAAVARQPAWGLPAPTRDAAALAALAATVRERFQQHFWNPTAGRFVACVDRAGTAHDYGYTFVNAEAIHYGLASPAQAREVIAWLDGQRTVAGDTATGADIYHWRFGPRASTRRNLDWYTFVWSNPETIPWGGQVQDGGAVLGFAYHDQSARLATAGPDNAWQALRRTLDWFADIRAAGGYRAYYAVGGRGTLQGGGPPGGLGMDQEFFESALVPQLVLYGFLGLEARADGLALNPRLPRDWPSLTLDRIHFRDTVLTITATATTLTIRCQGGAPRPYRLDLGPGWGGLPATVTLGDGLTLEARRG